eukprot:scaffold27514_cov69-Cyclotella_meneghiniana.AAC.4
MERTAAQFPTSSPVNITAVPTLIATLPNFPVPTYEPTVIEVIETPNPVSPVPSPIPVVSTPQPTEIQSTPAPTDRPVTDPPTPLPIATTPPPVITPQPVTPLPTSRPITSKPTMSPITPEPTFDDSTPQPTPVSTSVPTSRRPSPLVSNYFHILSIEHEITSDAQQCKTTNHFFNIAYQQANSCTYYCSGM